MAEAIGIVAAAISFAQATAVVLDGMNKVKDAPKNIQELRYELQGLETVLRQIGTFPCERGDPTEPVLRSCSDTLKQLHDVIAPFRQEMEDNKIKQYVRGLRIRPKESEIESAVKRLQSQKLTLTLALLASVSRRSDRILPTVNSTHEQYQRRHLRDEGMAKEHGEAGAKSWDMNLLTQIVNHKMTSLMQQLHQDPTSKIEDLLDLDGAQADELWSLNLESVQKLKGAMDQKKREQFLESLFTPDYQKDRVQIKDASMTTCEWILDHHKYLSFRRSTESCMLHLLGKAGSGKSVLAKHVWKRLSKELADSLGNDSCALLYYCCDKRTRSDETASSMLRALVHQLLWERPSLFSKAIARNELMQSHSFSGRPTTWTFDSLWSIFKAIILNSQLQMIHCVIDALDECEMESMEMFLSLLPELLDQGRNGVTVKLFLTSRIEGYIVDCLEGHAASIWVDSLTRHDVETYIGERLGKLKRRLRLNSEGEKSLRQVLVDRAEGMFLWAELAIKDLERAHGFTAKTLATRVQSLPSGLDALYERMLTKIDGMCQENEDTIRLVRKIFIWVALATRPLTLAELRIALAIELDTEYLDAVEPLQNISYDLLDLCGSLIEIVPTDDKTQAHSGSPTVEAQTKDEEDEDLNATVRLIHQSAKEYLIDSTSNLNGPLSKFRINSQGGNGEIAQACLTYLLCKDFEDGPIKENTADSHEPGTDPTATTAMLLKEKLAKYEFLDYAALHWPTHVRECGGEEVHLHACKFLSEFPGQFQSWYQISFYLRNSEANHNTGFAGIHAAARCGLQDVLRLMLNRGAEIEAKTTNNWTALHYAALNGHLEVVKQLLDRGAKIEAKITDNWTALYYAVQNGYLEVVKLLLDRGAEIEAKITSNRTALHCAAWKGHQGVVNLLLDRRAEIEVKDSKDHTPLHLSAHNGYLETSLVLLERGANIEEKNKSGRTAIHDAASNGHVKVVALLLDQAADIQAKDDENWSVLQFAASSGNIELVQMLLDRGSDIHAKNTNGQTTLFTTAGYGYQAVVELLLNRGAEVSAKDDDNNTSLHVTAQNGYLEVVKLLLDRGAEIGAKNTNNRTALHYAALNGHVEVAKLLLDRGAEIEKKTPMNSTALHLAAQEGHLEAVRLLLNRGAKVEAKGINDFTALRSAAQSGHLDTVRLLLDRGAEIGTKDSDSWTPLHGAASDGHLEVVKQLLDGGAEIEAKTTDNWTALHYAAQNGHLEVVKQLLDGGAEIEAKDTNNRTALHYAVQNGQLEVVELLFESTADPNVEGREYANIMQAAAFNGKERLVQLLLERHTGTNLQNGAYDEALQLACLNGHTAVVDCLIRVGADANMVDAHGWTPLLCALKFQPKKVLGKLLAAGVDLDSVPKSIPLPPTSWSSIDISPRLLLDDNAMIVRYADTENNEQTKAGAVRANHPIPLQHTTFYFEIEILNIGETGAIGLGLCSGYTSLDAFPGWNPSSWGFHGDISVFYAEGTMTTYGETFETGDVIGCHFSSDKGISFTKNGNSLGNAIGDISGKLYPVVGMTGRGTCVRVNFGLESFRYDVNAE